MHADRTVTFRFRDPNAKEVMLALEGTKPQPMQKDDQGVWSITTAPLEPDYYGYSFVADGVNLVDPSNSLMKTNLLFQSNMVHVPGATPEVWDTTEVPHGVIHHYFYHSGVVGDDRDYFVYTPPGYDPARFELARRLLHGGAKPAMVGLDLYPIPGGKVDVNNGIGRQISMGMPGENWDWPDASPAH